MMQRVKQKYPSSVIMAAMTAVMSVLVTTGAYAVNLATGYYFRYDFSGGIKEFGGTTS